MIEAEVLQNYDPSLSIAALSLVKNSTYPPRRLARGPVQTGAFINVDFGARQLGERKFSTGSIQEGRFP